MNLIEQLGGYENAKRFTNGECSDGFDVKELRDALLEYRRQYNIFEDKDFYVYLHDWDCDLSILCKFNSIDWGDHLWNIKNMIRHATDAEIKAGHRL